MVFFSYAYMSLNTGTGALLLFGFVQITMFWAALSRGEKFPPLAWAGLGLAVLGMAYLLAPGISAPDPFYALLMAIAGIAWGIYSLLGKNASDPTANTATNFLYAALPAFILGIYGLNTSTPSLEGVALAAASGVVASALGYAIWYKAIKELRRTTAATVQLSVPAIAAIAGVIFLAEPISTRIIIAVTLTLVGIGTIIRVQQKEKYNGDGVEGQRI